MKKAIFGLAVRIAIWYNPRSVGRPGIARGIGIYTFSEAAMYAWIKAIVDGEDLRWEYLVIGAHAIGKMDHDEDVSELSEDEIKDLTATMLDAEDQREKIRIMYR